MDLTTALRKFQKSFATFGIVAIIASLSVASAASAFSDVKTSDWYYANVQQLADAGVIDGTKDMFNGGANLNRAEAAKIAVLAAGVAEADLVNPATPSFSDVPASLWAYKYIETAKSLGYVSGDAGKTTFRPGANVNRAEYAKMMTLALELEAKTTGAPHFSDVKSADWFYGAVETAYNWSVVNGYEGGVFKPAAAISRAEMSAMTTRAMDPVARVAGSTPTTPGVSGSVSVALASSNPAAGTLVAGQATADLLHVTFSGTGTVSQVTLQRTGLSQNAYLTNVYLYEGATRITDSASVNSTGAITFNNVGLAVAGSKTISVKADIATGASGSTIGASMTGFTAAGATAPTTVTGVVGNVMNVATSTGLLATVNFTPATASTPSVNAGITNYTVWTSPVQVNTNAVWLKSAGFHFVGSAPTDALANIGLYVDGTKASTAAGVNALGYIVFDLTANPLVLKTGSHTVDVRADVVKGSSRTLSLSLQNAGDFMITDSQIGVNVAPTKASSAFSAIQGNTITISAGSVTTNINSGFTALTNVTGGASNALLGKFTLKAYGEDVKVNSLVVTPSIASPSYASSCSSPCTAGSMNNIALYYNGSQVASSQNYTGSALTFQLGSSMILTANTEAFLEVHGDLQTNTNINYTAGTVTVALTGGSTTNNGQGMSSLDSTVDVPSATSLATSGLTIQTGLLGVAKSSYQAQTLNANTAGAKIASFSLQNQSSSESVHVTNLAVDLAFAAPTYSSGTVTTGATRTVTVSSSAGFSVGNTIAIDCSTDAVGVVATVASSTTVTVDFSISGSSCSGGATISGSSPTVGPAVLTSLSNLKTSETTGSGATPVNPQASNNFSVDFVLAAGATKTIDVFADVSTANFGAVTASLTATSLGTNSNVAVSQNGNGTAVAGQVITLASGTFGTPTFVTSSSTAAQYIAAAAGATDGSKATFNLTASNGTAVVSELKFTVTGSGVASVRVGTTSAPVISGVAWLTGLNLNVPSGGSGLNVDVYPTYSAIGTNGIASNTSALVSLTYAKYTLGGTTGTSCTSGCGTTISAVDALTMKLVGSKPTVTVAQPVTSPAVGNVEAIDVTVTASAAGDIKLVSLPLTFSKNGLLFNDTGANLVIVKDAGGNTIASTSDALAATGGASTVVFDTPYLITAGQSQTFRIYAPVASVSGSTAGSQSIYSSLVTGTGFSWMDTAGANTTALTNTTYMYNYPSSFTSVVKN